MFLKFRRAKPQLSEEEIYARRARDAEERVARLQTFGKYARYIIAKTPSGLFAVDPQDDFVGGLLLREGQYGLGEVELLRGLIQASDRVLLVGAHIGALVVPVSRFSAEMVVVEANPATFDLLEMNVRLNDVRNVKLMHCAASDKEGSIEFLASKDNSGGSKRVPLKRDHRYYYDAPDKVSVKAVALDEALPGQRFDFVFMDIEGSEYFAVEGAKRILGEARHLIMEYIPHHLENVAGVGASEMWGRLKSHFSTMYVPTRRTVFEGEAILKELQRMFEAQECHDGLLFSKLSVEEVLKIVPKPPAA